MRVVAIPCLTDNYSFLLVDERSETAIVIDPAEPDPVVEAIDCAGARVTAVWCTHHHPDHVGGVTALVDRFPGIDVLGHRLDEDRIPCLGRMLDGGESLSFGPTPAEVLFVPGHTRGHVAYVLRPEGEAPWIFSGDTLFLGGCGRVFEGTPSQMVHSLDSLRRLPVESRVACAHEYTEVNLRFARHVEPENAAITARIAAVRGVRARSEPTVPGRLSEELETNPFLRLDVPAVRAHVGLGASADRVEVFTRLREEKNGFR